MPTLFLVLLLAVASVSSFAQNTDAQAVQCALFETPDKFQPDKRFFMGPSLEVHSDYHGNKLVIRPILLWEIQKKLATTIWQCTYASKKWLFADSVIVLCDGSVTGLEKFEGPFRKILDSGTLNETVSVRVSDSFAVKFAQAPDSAVDMRVAGTQGNLDVRFTPSSVTCLQDLLNQIRLKKTELLGDK